MAKQTVQQELYFTSDVVTKSRSRRFAIKEFEEHLQQLANAHNVYMEKADLLKILGASLRDLLYNDLRKINDVKPRYAMLYREEEANEVRRKIAAGPKRGAVFNVFWICIANASGKQDGLVLLDRDEIAKEAGTAPEDVSHCMKLLQSYGAIRIEREKGRARYYVRPLIGWNGPETDFQKRVRRGKKFLTERFDEVVGEGDHLGI